MALVASALLLTIPFTIALAPASSGAAATAEAVVPCATPPPANLNGFTPAALADHYQFSTLHSAGYAGQHQTAAILEFGSSVDADALAQFESCLGLGSTPFTQTLYGGGSMPAAAGEPQGDAESLVTGAPNLDRLYSIVTNGSEADDLAPILAGLLAGTYTDGRPPDVVSLSFGTCEPNWKDPKAVEAIDAGLQKLAAAGTWFLKAAGDAGSSDCSPHQTGCVPSLSALAVGYPASSPFVTAVGGTQVVNDVFEVWNEVPLSGACAGSGGGLSTLFPRPPFQDRVPDGAVPATRGVPDVSALAGRPFYLQYGVIPGTATADWYTNGGTSFAAPLYAGALASVRSMLWALHITPPRSLNDTLYRLANDPAQYGRVFTDLVGGTNDIYPTLVDCCTATRGYDLATGLGELKFGALAEALSIAPLIPPPATPAAAVVPAFTG